MYRRRPEIILHAVAAYIADHGIIARFATAYISTLRYLTRVLEPSNC